MQLFLAQLNPTIGDLEGNTQKVLAALDRARKLGADIALFPELALSGYPPEDLLLDASFIDAVEKKLPLIEKASHGLFAAVGLPRWNPSRIEKPLYNSAALFADGKLIGFKDKTLLPTYDVFDERRFFEPGQAEGIWEYRGKKIAVAICEDLWQCSKEVGYTHYRIDPVQVLKKKRPDLVLNLSASPYAFGRRDQRIEVFRKAALEMGAPLALCNQVGAQDQLVFDGHSFYLDVKGELQHLAQGFQEVDLCLDTSLQKSPFSPPEEGMGDLYAALVLGVRDYFHKQGFTRALLGLSGGIDSALVACIAVDALGPSCVSALNLPARYSSPESYRDAAQLAHNLQMELQRIDIDPLFAKYLTTLEPFFGSRPLDATEENLQSRVRAMILMAFSNKLGALVLNTGNKSEFAMGYTTLYGDMCGGLAVLLDVTKQRVYKLARYVNQKKSLIPEAIFKKAPSAELKPNQTDQDTLPPYEILDPVIEDFIEQRLPLEEIARKRKLPLPQVAEIAHRIHLAEYKRRQAPIGLRVTSKCFSKGRNVPIVQKWK